MADKPDQHTPHAGDDGSTKPGQDRPRRVISTPHQSKDFGGSSSDTFNKVLAAQVVETLWLAHADDEGRTRLFDAALDALAGIKPTDEIEGMLAAQMVAAHNATMECFRRAMLPQQSAEGRKENLAQANKLSRTYVSLTEGLNRHRGKGQQKVTVEHVHVHAGGQAIVGAVEGGGGVASENQGQCVIQQLRTGLLDHLVSAGEERGRDRHPECRRLLEVDDDLDGRDTIERQFARALALKNSIELGGKLAVDLCHVRAEGDQPAGIGKCSTRVYSGFTART